MKKTKMYVGSLMIIVSFLILLQSRALLRLWSINNTASTSGTAGRRMAMAYFLAGIIYIATRKFKSIGGDVAGAAILGFFGFTSLFSVSSMLGDLSIWIWLAFLIGITFLVWHIRENQREHIDFAPKAEIQRPLNSRYEMHRRRH